MFHFNLYMIDLQLLLWRDRESISSIFVLLRNDPRATNSLPASLPARDCVQNWNTQLSAGEINGTYTSCLCDVLSEPAKLAAQLCAHVCDVWFLLPERMFLSKQWNSQLQTGGHFWRRRAVIFIRKHIGSIIHASINRWYNTALFEQCGVSTITVITMHPTAAMRWFSRGQSVSRSTAR